MRDALYATVASVHLKNCDRNTNWTEEIVSELLYLLLRSQSWSERITLIQSRAVNKIESKKNVIRQLPQINYTASNDRYSKHILVSDMNTCRGRKTALTISHKQILVHLINFLPFCVQRMTLTVLRQKFLPQSINWIFRCFTERHKIRIHYPIALKRPTLNDVKSN